jgi:hypothetical protein
MGNLESGEDSAPSDVNGARPSRRPYTKPELTAYGPLAKLTRSSQSGSGENTAQGAMRKCL